MTSGEDTKAQDTEHVPYQMSEPLDRSAGYPGVRTDLLTGQIPERRSRRLDLSMLGPCTCHDRLY